MSWSPDGKRLVYWVHDPKGAGDIWILPMDGVPANAVSSQILPEVPIQGLIVAKNWTSALRKKK